MLHVRQDVSALPRWLRRSCRVSPPVFFYLFGSCVYESLHGVGRLPSDLDSHPFVVVVFRVYGYDCGVELAFPACFPVFSGRAYQRAPVVALAYPSAA